MILTTTEKIIWCVLQVTLGLIPCGLWMDWVQFNCSHPLLPSSLPLYDLQLSFPFQILFDLFLFFIFGFTHTFLAQTHVVYLLKKYVSSQAIRSVYMICTGLCCILMITMWQPIENSQMWVFPFFSMKTNKVVRFVLFYTFFMMVVPVIYRFGVFDFFGLKQLFEDDVRRPEGNPVLIKTGFFRISRHPMYTFTLLAFLATPILDWNRILIIIACSIYLYFAIPIEEKKLVKLFGNPYVEYQKRVPRIIPTIFSIFGKKIKTKK